MPLIEPVNKTVWNLRKFIESKEYLHKTWFTPAMGLGFRLRPFLHT